MTNMRSAVNAHLHTRQLITLLAAGLLVTLLNACSSAETATGALTNGAKAPEVRTVTADGKSISLSDHRGNIVLLAFWDSGNMAARRNHPELQRLYDTYKDADFKEAKGFCVYSISLDTDKAKWLSAVQEDGITWTCQTIDTAGWNAESATAYQVNYTPRYFLIDGSGEIISRHVSIAELDELLSERLDKRSSRP